MNFLTSHPVILCHISYHNSYHNFKSPTNCYNSKVTVVIVVADQFQFTVKFEWTNLSWLTYCFHTQSQFDVLLPGYECKTVMCLIGFSFATGSKIWPPRQVILCHTFFKLTIFLFILLQATSVFFWNGTELNFKMPGASRVGYEHLLGRMLCILPSKQGKKTPTRKHQPAMLRYL